MCLLSWPLRNDENMKTQSATEFAEKQSLTEYGGGHLPSGLLYRLYKGKMWRKENTGLGIWTPVPSTARTLPVTLDKSLPLSGPLIPLLFKEKAQREVISKVPSNLQVLVSIPQWQKSRWIVIKVLSGYLSFIRPTERLQLWDWGSRSRLNRSTLNFLWQLCVIYCWLGI